MSIGVYVSLRRIGESEVYSQRSSGSVACFQVKALNSTKRRLKTIIVGVYLLGFFIGVQKLMG